MIDAAWLFSAITFAVAMVGTPGPNNAMVAASGANFGFGRTVPHQLGITFGFPVMMVAVALGAGDVLRIWPWLHSALKWLGAAYLLWLAWKIAMTRPKPTEGAMPGQPLTFLQAALFQWVNPKAWIISLGAIATFTTAGAVLGQSLVLCVIFVSVTWPIVAFWTLTGVGAARVLQTERGLRAFNWVMAGLLVASLLPVLRDGS